MSEALYRTYRPKVFDDLVDQQHVRITLQHALELNRVAHAYLFAGPHGVGKTTIARLLARAVNCTDLKAHGEPCNKCPSCLAILKGNNLDVMEIDAASQTGVDNVRENVIQSARSIPTMSKKKVFIIDEVHMLSMAAFNALLKLLEEPPAHAMFILATTEIHRIPETIISRTQRFDFKKIALADIVTRLQKLAVAEKRKLDDDVAMRIARRAGGSIRDAESMLGQLFSFAESRITNDLADLVLPRSDQQLVLSLLQALIKHQTGEALNLFHKFCEEGGDIAHLVNQLVLTARGVMLAAVDPILIQQISPDIDQTELTVLAALAKDSPTSYLIKLVETLLTAQKQLNRAVMAELPVELAFISLTQTDQPVLPEKPVAITPTNSRPLDTKLPTNKKKLSAKSQFTIETIKSSWAKIQQLIRQKQPSLGLCIQYAEAGELNDQELIINVPFKLHAERLSDPKNKKLLGDVIESIIGQPVSISILTISLPENATQPTTKSAVPNSPAQTGAGELWDQVVASFN